MLTFTIPIQVRWADIDPNRHLRHSAYYDYAATARVACFSQLGLTNQQFNGLKTGPIVFREEALFKKEVKFEDQITVDIGLVKARIDFSRWTIRHHLYKQDHSIAAIVTLDGAFMDLELRKLKIPEMVIRDAMEQFPKAEEFEFISP